MATSIQLQPHLSVDVLERRYRAAKEPHERTGWQILWLLMRGQSAGQVAQVTGYSRYWIGQLAKRYGEHGPAGMHNRQRTTSRRASPLRSAARQEALRRALQGAPPEGSRRWTARAVAAWVRAALGRRVGAQRGWEYLQRLKHGQRLPRPRHALAAPAEQEAFKKAPPPAEVGGDGVPGGEGRRSNPGPRTSAATG